MDLHEDRAIKDFISGTRSSFAHEADILACTGDLHLANIQNPFSDFTKSERGEYITSGGLAGRDLHQNDDQNEAHLAATKGLNSFAGISAEIQGRTLSMMVEFSKVGLLSNAQIADIRATTARYKALAIQLEESRAAQLALEEAAAAGIMAKDAQGNIAMTDEEAVTEGATVEDTINNPSAVQADAEDAMIKTNGMGINNAAINGESSTAVANVMGRARDEASGECNHAEHRATATGPVAGL